MFLKQKAQSTLEYAILIAVVIAALLAIQIYAKRGIEGRLKSSTDDIGQQFEASDTTFIYETGRTSKTVEETTAGVASVYMGKDGKGTPEAVVRKGEETVEAWQE